MVWRFHLIRRPTGLHSRGIGAILQQRNNLDFVRFAEAIPWMRGGLSAFIAGLNRLREEIPDWRFLESAMRKKIAVHIPVFLVTVKSKS